jgi:AAA15 family ATPase/GTPase
MIISFSVLNFGSIQEKQTLSFEASKDPTLAPYYTFEALPKLFLLKIGFILGANASGKTTVLKALEFLRQLVKNPAQNIAEKIDFQPFILNHLSSTNPTFFELMFVQEGKKYRYQVTLNQQCILSETLKFYPNGREATFFTRTTDATHQTVAIQYGSLDTKSDSKNRLKLEAGTLWNNLVLGTFSKSNIDFKALKMVYTWFDDYLMPLITPKTNLFDWTLRQIEMNPAMKSEVIHLLQYADFQIDSFEMVQNKNQEKEIFFHHKCKNEWGDWVQMPFKQGQESQGTLRYFGLGGILALLTTASKAIVIDEFETSLHPDLAQNFILRFLTHAKNAQLLITTHQIDFLGQSDILRRDAIWFTHKNEQGATELYSVADFDTTQLRKNASLLHAYEAGKLGGKPNLGSIFL